MSEAAIKKIFKGKNIIDQYSHDAERNPDTLYISVHEACNEDCVFCILKGNSGQFGRMSLLEIKATIRKFLKAGGRHIVFTGGEPTLRNDLPAAIQYAEQFPELQSLSVITNGVRLADARYRQALLRADTKGKLSFCFSLHSHRARISELLTASRGTFAQTIRGISAMVKAGRAGSIYQVITSKNYQDLPSFAAFLKRTWPEIKDVTLAYPLPQGNVLLNQWIYVEFSKLKPHLLKALKFLEEEQYLVNVASCGQFPLCVIPGHEETVLRPLAEGEQLVSGVVGEKSFHEFEMASPEWVKEYKIGGKRCNRCVLRTYCQGFWKEYVALHGLNGIKLVTPRTFAGPKVYAPLSSKAHVGNVLQRLAKGKLNLVVATKVQPAFLEQLKQSLKKEKILAVVAQGSRILYP